MNAVERTTIRILNSFAGMVIFIISFAVFYMPYELRIIPQVSRAVTFAGYICEGVLLVSFFFLYASSLTVFRKNWALIAAAGFTGTLIFSTVMNGADIQSALGTYGLYGLFLAVDIAVFFKVDPRKYLLTAFFLLLAVNIANTYTVFRFWGTGMWETYGQSRNVFYSLIGNYNGGIEYVMPMAICGSAYAARYGRWLDIINYPAMFMSVIMAFRCDSATQKVAFCAIILFMVLGSFAMLFRRFARFLRLVFQPVILIAVDFAVFISVVLLNKTNWVVSIGIDPDFHNRRHIWNMSMEYIKANPVWGNGQETVAQEASKITGYAHSHCTYLEIAYKTGFIGAVFMILMLVAVIVSLYRCRDDRLSFMMSAMLFIFGLAAIAETYPMPYVILCLALIYYTAVNSSGSEGRPGKIRKMSSEPQTVDF